MLGAIIGDIAGSRFEWNNIKSKEFDLLTYRCEPTDDSIMTLAVAKALLESKDDYRVLTDKTIKWMQTLGRKYPHAGYGGNFHKWLLSDSPKPYNSYGNGAAMRVSPCAYVASSMDEAKLLARIVTEVTHNHAEGIKGAEAVTVAIYMALHGSNLLEIQDYINANYYHITFKLDDIRPTYTFDVSCQGSVPQALEAFFESTDYEDTIRNAISIGGDSDTIAAIAGSVAEAYYGIPAALRKHGLTFLDGDQIKILTDFEDKFGFISEKETKSGLKRTKHKPMKDVSKNTEALSREDIVLEAIKESDLADRTTEYWKKITSNALFNHLFEACNILRGPIDQDDYKSYVIPILFFKRISDVYDEETAENEEQYGDDIAFYPEEELHTFVIPKGCHWNDVRNTSEDVGKAIVDAMMGIEHANPDTMAGLFSSFDDANWTDKTKLDDERLKNLIEHMSSMPVGNKNYSADVMGDAYEYLIKKFADMSKKNAGEFYTPRSIVKLMVQLLNPKSGESVYDPACGTGGMLIEAIRNMDDEKASYGKIYGQEKNLSTSAIARMNLFLHGAKEFKIVREDTLRKPVFIHNGQLQQFDCVLANPPFGLDHWGAEIFENDQWGRNIWGSPTDSNADFAWLQHMYKSMRPGKGRCAVVMPQGVLFHGGREGDIRKKMRLRAHVWVGNSLCLP
ncbi:N-6 DNA methylase [Chordicoccus furentiruminis]|uniref:N-6 DNA methylase n=1 Tax=Chordicoccus furentiruminis TaxID=2709410 RepID=UPI0023A886BE|nr:N-6 DNA methylase [Chordicoccus furentiruminis]